METITFELPIMFGDHHVQEVRRLLLDLPGVTEVYASSCFQIVEINYDENEINEKILEDTLEKSGYLGEFQVPVESGATADKQNGEAVYFRHTAVIEQAGPTVTFSQTAPYQGKPLWPCPNLGTLVDKS